jgi:hypothetical protein
MKNKKKKGICPDCGHEVEFIDIGNPFNLTDTQITMLNDAVETLCRSGESAMIEGIAIMPMILRPPATGWSDDEIHAQIFPPEGVKELMGCGGSVRPSQPWGQILIRLTTVDSDAPFDLGWFATSDLLCPFDFGLFSDEKPLNLVFKLTEQGSHAPIEMVVFGIAP